MTKQTQLSLLAVVGVLVIAGAVFLLTQKDNPPPVAQPNSNLVQYEDQTNGAKFSHHKDWQVTNSYGFTRLQIPVTGQTQFVQISYLPTQQKLNELKFGLASNNKIQIGSKNLEVVTQEIAWKVPAGQPSGTSKTTYYLWTKDNRKILIQVDPAQDPLSDDAKKVIETLELGL